MPGDPPQNSLIIVIRTPIEMRKFTTILSAVGRAFPKSHVNMKPTAKTVRVDGWLVEVGGDEDA